MEKITVSDMAGCQWGRDPSMLAISNYKHN